MIANFDSGTHNIYIFLETGELPVLEEEPVEGNILTTSNPGRKPGNIKMTYSEEQERRPEVSRETSQERSISDFEVEIFEPVYQHLESDNIYHNRIGAFQDLKEEGKIWIFPSENREGYEYMLNDLEFYQELTPEQRQKYREKL